MFDQLNGMPLHPLLIHAPVFAIPLAFLLAGLFAFPRTRSWARWPLAVTVLGATAATFAAKESGEALAARMNFPAGTPVANLIQQHSALADQLFYIMLGRSEEHTSELQSRQYLVCRLLLEKKKHTIT